MNTQGGPLEFEFDLRVGDLEKKLAMVEKQLSGVSGNLVKEGSKIDKAWAFGLSAIAGLAIGKFIGNTLRDIVAVRAEFEKLEAVLTNTFGDESRAKNALAMIQAFAAKTPFQVTDLTNSFVKLVNQGFEPTMDDMTALGDLASSTGKGFDQLSEAILDAQTMQFERLKEFGIKAEKAGNKIVFTFKQQKTVVDANSDSIQKYILSLGKVEGVSGSMEAISKTMVGQISNMKDAWDQLMNTLGNKTEGPIKFAITQLGLLLAALTRMNTSLDERRQKMLIENAGVDYELAKKEIDAAAQQKVKQGVDLETAKQQALDEYKEQAIKTIRKFGQEITDSEVEINKIKSKEGFNIKDKIKDKEKIENLQKQIKFSQDLLDITKKTYEALNAKPVTPTSTDTTTPLTKEEKIVLLAKKNLDVLMKQTEEMSKQMFLQARAKEYQENKQLGPEETKTFLKQYEKEYELQQKNLKAEKEKYKTILLEANAEARFNTFLAKGVSVSRIIADNFAGIDNNLAKIAQSIAEEFDRVNRMSQDFKVIGDQDSTKSEKIYAAADAFSAVASQISELVSALNSMSENKMNSKLEASMLKVAFALDEINRAASDNKLQKFKEGLEEIKKTGTDINARYVNMSIADIQREIIHYQSKIGTAWLDSQNKKFEQHLKDYQNLLDLKQQELDLQNQLNEALTGTTSDSITDSIVQGFEDGYSSIEDFGQTFEDTMKKAVLNSFKMKMLEPAMNKFFIEFSKAMESDGGISTKEEQDLRKKWDGWMAQFTAGTQTIDQMFKDWGFDTGTDAQKSLAGSISSITEDTADILAGTMNSMRINGIQQLQVAQSGLLTLQKIADNTFKIGETNSLLREMNNKMSSGGQLTSNRALGR